MKAFPGAPDATHNIIGVRAFLAALSPSLNQRAGDFEPKTIAEAARKAMILESLEVAMEQASGAFQTVNRVETPSLVDCGCAA